MGNKYESDKRENRAEKRSERERVMAEAIADAEQEPDDPEAEWVQPRRPTRCAYCKGTGWMQVVGVMNAECGFCDNGIPLDTQEDWDNSWGRVLGTVICSICKETGHVAIEHHSDPERDQ